MRRTTAAFLALLLAAVLAPSLGGGTSPPSEVVATWRPPPLAAHVAALRGFDACRDLLGHLRAEALRRVGPYGLEGVHAWLDRTMATSDAAEGAGFARTAAPPVAGVDYSGTNVQEAGVDEPDLVKTDGQRLVAIAAGRLRVFDLAGEAPREVAQLRLPEEHASGELLLDGDRLLVLANRWRPLPLREQAQDAPLAFDAPALWGGVPSTVLTLYDLALGAPREVASLEVDASYASARLVDGVARVVVRAGVPGLATTVPQEGGARAALGAERSNREVVRTSTLADWLPDAVHTAGGLTTERTLTACDRVHAPAEFAGFGTVSVLTLDLGGDLADPAAATVLAGGDTVYASPSTLYVATNRWAEAAAGQRRPGGGDYTTELHAFDISQPDGARYLASGSVPGHLLNQFSLSEHAGFLRVATTEGAPWDGGTESAVRVLERRGDRLVEVGHVGGLGLGERIYAVRFLGDVGYVVTFREVDPLYTVDLREPSAPKVRGELKIPGYSAYLHPVGEDLVLGVGQDATDQGQALGTQISLFDVSDLDAPRQVHKTVVREANSEVEYDHHAFLYWPPTGLVVLPAQLWSWNARTGVGGSWSGAFALEVDLAGGIRTLGSLSHQARGQEAPTFREDWSEPIRRSAIVGGILYTISDDGLLASDPGSLATVAWVGFAR